MSTPLERWYWRRAFRFSLGKGGEEGREGGREGGKGGRHDGSVIQ
jgi:hypothetical protein